MQLRSDGRFNLGLGGGENLNEHVVGGQWPIATVRHGMLEEAVEIIRALWAGGNVTYRGKHFDVESAGVWDLPDTAPPIGIAMSGPASCRLADRHADVMIAVQPQFELGRMFTCRTGTGWWPSTFRALMYVTHAALPHLVRAADSSPAGSQIWSTAARPQDA